MNAFTFRTILLTTIFVLLNVCVQAQVGNDSLLRIWDDETEQDSLRFEALRQFGVSNIYVKSDTVAFLVREGQDYFKSKGLYEEQGRLLILESYCMMTKDRIDQMNLLLDSAGHIFEKIGSQKGKGILLSARSTIYSGLGNFPLALYYLDKSMDLSAEQGDTLSLISLLGQLSYIHYVLKNKDKYLECSERALTLSREINNPLYIASTIAAAGYANLDLENYEKAESLFLEGYDLSKRTNNMFVQAQTLTYLGEIANNKGEYEKALDLFKQSLELQEKEGIDAEKAWLLMKMGDNYLDMERLPEGIERCMEAYDNSLRINEGLGVRTSCECLYKGYKLSGQTDKALSFLEEFNKYNAEIGEKESARAIQQIEFEQKTRSDSLEQLAKELILKNKHEAVLRIKDRNRNLSLGGGLFFLLLAGGMSFRYRYIKKSRDAIAEEKLISENLLLNILPAEIAEELKLKGSADARDFEKASILFTDFKEFTQASEKLNAHDLVKEINTCFEAFDGIIEKYSIEKIKTIGDAYMAAGGLPIPDNDSTKNIVLAAIEMQQFIELRKVEHEAQGLTAFQMRAGIHTGPVVAGIVGVKKFQYDIWGDTVNTASRMESSGEVGKVNISQTTYELIKDEGSFSFESRGKLEVKGKGLVEMWFVRLNKEKV